MKIFIYAAGMPFNGRTIDDGKSLGGSESAAYYIAKEIAKKGHTVVLFSNISNDLQNIFDGVTYYSIGRITAENPFGEQFERYAQCIPHEILICQRISGFFDKMYNSKINLWWLHDLAIKRYLPFVNSHLWNINKILTVSEFHKKQVADNYSISTDCIDILPNAVDKSLYTENINVQRKLASKTMIFSSRPERGLEQLVMPNGVMEKLLSVDPEIRLIVCGYDNTTQEMSQYYNMLWQRCNQMPNVKLIGPQSKQQLAIIQQNAWLQIYPTSFEETSCITAMESQCAGTPFVCSDFGALTETLNGGGYYLVDKAKNGTIDVDRYVDKIKEILKNTSEWENKHKIAKTLSNKFCWGKSAETLIKVIHEEFKKQTSNPNRMLKHFLRYSDVNTAKKYIKINNIDADKGLEKKLSKYDAIYNSYEKYYIDVANKVTPRAKGILGNWKYLEQDDRIKPIIKEIATLKPGSFVLDYGCWIGQQTTYYARLFPQINFVGVDISALNIEVAKKFVLSQGINNVEYLVVKNPDELELLKHKYELIVAGELLEHCIKPEEFIEQLEYYVKDGGRIVFTIPAGISDEYQEHKDLNEPPQHINFLTDIDVFDIAPKRKDITVNYLSYGFTEGGEFRGSLAIAWKVEKDNLNYGEINYERKFYEQSPQQTLSATLLIKPDGDSLAKTLRSVAAISDEIIIGIDGKPEQGEAWKIARKFGAKVFSVPSPLDVGFDVARNLIIEKATMDWILWIDDDEVLKWPERIRKFLRSNQYYSYGIHQHHFAADPPGIIKTDYPCRLFRNNKGIKFFGVVHEHPETKLNEGAGKTFVIPPNVLAICHNGYDTEQIRRERFIRNWPLMQRDRKKYPDRELAKFLWIRDLAHINRFEFEQTKQITQIMIQRAEEGVREWRKLVADKKYRLVRESLMYYTECVNLLTRGGGLVMDVGLRANIMNIGDKINGEAMPFQRAKFLNEKDAYDFGVCMLNEKLEPITNQKYL